MVLCSSAAHIGLLLYGHKSACHNDELTHSRSGAQALCESTMATHGVS